MLIRQLEYFVAVARERHFGRAAAACYASQPALSAGLAKLECELGVTLVRRGQYFEGLTLEGERLAIWARKVLADRDELKAEAQALKSGMDGTFCIGTDSAVSIPVVELVAAFCTAHPRTEAKVRTALTSAELLRLLRNHELDVAISHFKCADLKDLRLVPLYREELVVLVPQEKLLPGTRSMTWLQASQLPLALLTPSMGLREVIDKAFAGCGVCPNPQIETDSVASLLAHVAMGKWASVVPHTWLSLLPAGNTARAVQLVQPDTSAQVSMALHPTAPDPLVATTLLNMATNRPFSSGLRDGPERSLVSASSGQRS